MREAILERCLHVAPRRLRIARVERLQEEVVEVEMREALGLRCGMLLRIDELELVAVREYEGRIGLGTDAQMVHAGRREPRAVRLDGDLEAARVQRVDGVGVELQERLATSAYDERSSSVRAAVAGIGPAGQHRFGEGRGVGEATAVGAHADEIRVADLADRIVPVRFATRPEIAAAEAAEHGGTSRVPPLALQRVEDLLDGVRHTALSRLPRRSASDQ